MDKSPEDVNRLLRLNERTLSVDTPMGDDTEKPLLEALADQNADEAAWKTDQGQVYLDRYPGGTHAAEAARNFEQQLWADAERNGAYAEYLLRFPNGRWAREAPPRLATGYPTQRGYPCSRSPVGLRCS